LYIIDLLEEVKMIIRNREGKPGEDNAKIDQRKTKIEKKRKKVNCFVL
jgi:hypothetical protein